MRARLAALSTVVLGFGIGPWFRCHPLDHAPDGGTPLAPASGSNAPNSPTMQSPPRDEKVGKRELLGPPRPPPETPPITIADDAVVHALDNSRAAFSFCFKRAQRDDPTLSALKVNLHLYVDPTGSVLSAYTDVTDAKFAACLTSVARRLRFPAPGAMAVANMVFFAS
jgi:hypothetical protein